jgi:hypothetical protein
MCADSVCFAALPCLEKPLLLRGMFRLVITLAAAASGVHTETGAEIRAVLCACTCLAIADDWLRFPLRVTGMLVYCPPPTLTPVAAFTARAALQRPSTKPLEV